MHRHKIRFSLLLITILGFALRFYQPEDLGYFHVHNLENLNNARAWLDLAAFLENNLGAITSLKERNISISEVKNQWAVQSNHVNHLFGDVHYNIFLATNWPGFILLNILAILLWGVQLQSLGYYAAIFGVLCIPSFYFLGKAYKDSLTGLICALLVATSAFSIILSRFAYDGQQYIPFFSSLMLAFVLR